MATLIIVLPVFFIFFVGYIGQRLIGFEVRSISTMALYLMSPCLAFSTFYSNPLSPEHFYLLLYVIGVCAFLIIVIKVISKYRKYSNSEECGLILSTVFMNNGNYGTPVALFAFGQMGLYYAVILMVMQTVLMSSVGVYYAAKGGVVKIRPKAALRTITRIPIIYGAALGLIINIIGLNLPIVFTQSTEYIAQATVPTIMLVLGMQLATIKIEKSSISLIAQSVSIRLIISPFLVYLAVYFLPIPLILKQVMILMSGMPTAANTTLYALQFKTEPEMVAGCTLISTVLSLVTIPILLTLIL